MDPMSPEEALIYFGFPLTQEGHIQLEDLVVEHNIGVELDEYDQIISVDPSELKEVLFQEHLKNTGHRPDSPSEMARQKDKKVKEEKEKKDKMDKDKDKLKAKKDKEKP